MRDFDPTASEFITSGYIRNSRPGGQLFDPMTAAIVVGGNLVGGMMSSDAAGDAADTQAQSAREATAAQREMFDKQVQLQEPWRQAGMAGLNRLGYLTGLSPNGFAGGNPFGASTVAAAPGVSVETADQIRARLAPQFGGGTGVNIGGMTFIPNAETGGQWVAGGQPADEAGLNAAVQAEIQRQQAAQAQAQAQSQAQATQAGNDPAYGSLLKNFSRADFEVDPGYGFRKEEGERGLMRAAAASGGVGSGKYLKDAMRFNSGLASQEYGNAFNRFNVNRDSTFNKLASIAGIGQTATSKVGDAAGAFGQQIGSNIIGAGNALAAGRVGGANAINGAIGQGVSMYQQGQLMNQLFKPPTPSYAGAGTYSYQATGSQPWYEYSGTGM